MPEKTRFRWIHFVKQDGTDYWLCRNNRSDVYLGMVFFYDRWNKWCFSPTAMEVVLSPGCMEDIVTFCKSLEVPNGVD